MQYRDISLLVGDRGIEDTRKQEIPGRLIRPDSRSELLLIISCGLGGNHNDYSDNFGQLLGEEVNVYITEQRKKGWTKGSTLKQDFSQIEKQVKDIVETDNVVHIGHSMGAAVANGSTQEYGLQPRGLYGICAYPTLADTQIGAGDEKGETFMQNIIKLAARSELGPLLPFSQEPKLGMPCKIAIGTNDNILRTNRTEVLEVFQEKFQGYGAHVELFKGRNHCFNYKQKELAPFNKDDPQVLVDNVREFIYGLK